MREELPKIEDLRKGKEEVAGKIAVAKQAKEKDLREKVGNVETAINEIKNLEEYLKE